MAWVQIGRAAQRLVGVWFRRTPGGVIELRGRDDLELARGLGFAHAHDRQIQMMLLRLIGQGRLCECLKDDEDSLAVDVFMREMGFAWDAERDQAALTDEARALVEAYAQGVNEHLRTQPRRLEWRLVGYHPEPWTPADTLLTVKVMSYVGLAQSQQDMEKLLIEAVRGGVDLDRLRELFRPHLDGLTDDLVAAIRHARVHQPLLPPEVRLLAGLPRGMGSNNWAVAAHRSSTGHALQCNDPHLEANRLPAIWYEWIGHTSDDYRLGISMPGVPGLIMGRNRSLSFGFTYGFMDMIDYFLEDVRDGRVRREDGWEDLVERPETIRRKDGDPVDIVVRETPRGVLECDPRDPVPDGIHLCRAWSAYRGGAAGALDALLRLMGATDVHQGCEAARDVTLSCNWLLADREGHIAYQQSGLLPARAHSGLHPVPGWDPAFDWSGVVPAERLGKVVDPPDGVLATANQDLNLPGFPTAINLPMGSYRADRITELLARQEQHDVDGMKRIQRDLFSLQAKRLLGELEPCLPDRPGSEVLRSWDRCYDAASYGASLFEDVYSALLREVFGRRLFGLEAWDHIEHQTVILVDYYGFFDAVLLGEVGEEADWFGDEGRLGLMRRVLDDTLRDATPESWGARRKVMMRHVLLGGQLPSWLGFDRGPIVLEGNRATVVQGGIFTVNGRQTTFCPSWRYVTDLGSDRADTVLAGGPSDRRLSPDYFTDVERWLSYGYKTLFGRRPT